jgi:hypothetical protein
LIVNFNAGLAAVVNDTPVDETVAASGESAARNYFGFIEEFA